MPFRRLAFLTISRWYAPSALNETGRVLSLAGRIDGGPTPWFWSVNGSAGVLGSGVAVLVSMNFSIPTTLLVGAACYLLLALPALQLCRMARATPADSV
jgi:hypothetical protein